jgi:hypothetical protein
VIVGSRRVGVDDGVCIARGAVGVGIRGVPSIGGSALALVGTDGTLNPGGARAGSSEAAGTGEEFSDDASGGPLSGSCGGSIAVGTEMGTRNVPARRGAGIWTRSGSVGVGSSGGAGASVCRGEGLGRGVEVDATANVKSCAVVDTGVGVGLGKVAPKTADVGVPSSSTVVDTGAWDSVCCFTNNAVPATITAAAATVAAPPAT